MYIRGTAFSGSSPEKVRVREAFCIIAASAPLRSATSLCRPVSRAIFEYAYCQPVFSRTPVEPGSRSGAFASLERPSVDAPLRKGDLTRCVRFVFADGPLADVPRGPRRLVESVNAFEPHLDCKMVG